MIRKSIATYFGYLLQDLINKTDILDTLILLKESQYWSEDRIYEYQLKKLKKIIHYSKYNVPYYEKLFKKIKFDSSDIITLQDINKIPILTKEIVRKENMNLIARNFNKKLVRIGKTGGTTGAPVIVYSDIYNRSFTWASYYRWYEWMGLNYYDSIATFWGGPTVLSKSYKKIIISNITNFIQNNKIYDSFLMSDTNMLSMYNSIVQNKPVLLKGYLSAMISFAQYIDNNKFKIEKLKALSTTTETLLPHNRLFLEQVFNAPIYDQYGGGEISAISYECGRHNGLHINQEHVICQILDENNLNILNKSGYIIATDLDNLVMPFIRYKNDDMATLTLDKCSCGVNQPLMQSIEGRTIDTITLANGNKVHGVFITDILFELGISTNQIQRFQVYQEVGGDIEFRFESKFSLSLDQIKKIEFALRRFFNHVNIVETKHIPNEKNGKFKYIINNIYNNQ